MKIKVRIAVAVDPEGNWSSAGWRGGSDDELMGIAIDETAPGENRYFLEAKLDIPAATAKTVAADVLVDTGKES